MKKLLFLLLIILFIFSACEQDQIISVSDQVSRLDIELHGFQSQSDSAWYEAWLTWIKKTDKGDSLKTLSMGLLHQHEDGSLTGSRDLNLGILQGAQTVLITMETDSVPGYIITERDNQGQTGLDSVEGPGPYKLIAAKVEANGGTFTLGSEEVLDFDLDKISGMYILDTPTDPDRSDPTSGIWFVRLDTTNTTKPSSVQTPTDTIVSMLAGLNLPVLPADWYYEGWVEINGIAVSTGMFTKVNTNDNDSRYAAEQGSAFTFPGEDFFTNAPVGLTFPTDLSGCKTYISLMSDYPAGSENPFNQPLVLLEAQIPATARGRTVYEFQNMTGTLPGGEVKISIKLYD